MKGVVQQLFGLKGRFCGTRQYIREEGTDEKNGQHFEKAAKFWKMVLDDCYRNAEQHQGQYGSAYYCQQMKTGIAFLFL